LITQVSQKFGCCATVVNIDPRRVRKARSLESGVRDQSGATDQLNREGEDSSNSWWEVQINGGRVPTGLEAVTWAKKVEELGAGEIVLTSMDADGTKNGYDLPMLEAISLAVNIPVVASGGAGNPEHLRQAFIAGADAALAASIFHYNEYSIPDTKKYLAERGIPVRIAR
jgi:cyclase